MNAIMRHAFPWVLTWALLGMWLVTAALADSPRARGTLFNEPGGDTSAQCSSTGGYTMHITMTNRGDFGTIRVTYGDLDTVDYAIPANTTVQISLAGGGTSEIDRAIKVSGDGPGGSLLVGQVSALAEGAAVVLCCTSPSECDPPF
jgi:hypothetical protein